MGYNIVEIVTLSYPYLYLSIHNELKNILGDTEKIENFEQVEVHQSDVVLLTLDKFFNGETHYLIVELNHYSNF